MSGPHRTPLERNLLSWAEPRGWQYAGRTGLDRMRLRLLHTGAVVAVMGANRRRAECNARALLRRVERRTVVLAKRGGTVQADQQAAR